jgi:predicted O-methyltransferase YrrM
LPFLKDKFDVIYVDGCHDFANVYVDTRLSSDLLKKDGIVMFDDYWPKQSCDVYNAVSQLRREGYYNNKAELNSNNVLILGPQ